MAKTRRKIKRRKSRRNKRRGGGENTSNTLQKIIQQSENNINDSSIQRNTEILVRHITTEPEKYTAEFIDKVNFLKHQLVKEDVVANVKKTIQELKSMKIYEEKLNNKSAF